MFNEVQREALRSFDNYHCDGDGDGDDDMSPLSVGRAHKYTFSCGLHCKLCSGDEMSDAGV
jgi:hypothetical protein